MDSEVLIPAIVFFAIYQITRLLADYLLRRKLIKAGQYEKAGILDQSRQSDEANKYPSLKWGLVALTTGIGFIIINYFTIWKEDEGHRYMSQENFALSFGILLVSVAVGFLLYFLFVNRQNKQQ